MRAGRNRAVLNYQTSTSTRGPLGQSILTWTTVSTNSAEVRAPRGTEATVALQVKAFVSLMIKCHLPGYPFYPAGRLQDVTDPANPGIYNIISSVDPDGRRRRLLT